MKGMSVFVEADLAQYPLSGRFRGQSRHYSLASQKVLLLNGVEFFADRNFRLFVKERVPLGGVTKLPR
jgi:hypothetical protein